jgi:Holliday junction resolvase RusA-like endonuclease
MKRYVVVEIDYPGSCISCNHYLGRDREGNQFVRREARSWMDELGWAIKSWHIEEWRLPLIVTCDGVFLDESHRPDLSNLSKCTLDAIEDITGKNDKDFLWHDGTVTVDKKQKPHLLIKIEES